MTQSHFAMKHTAYRYIVIYLYLIAMSTKWEKLTHNRSLLSSEDLNIFFLSVIKIHLRHPFHLYLQPHMYSIYEGIKLFPSLHKLHRREFYTLIISHGFFLPWTRIARKILSRVEQNLPRGFYTTRAVQCMKIEVGKIWPIRNSFKFSLPRLTSLRKSTSSPRTYLIGSRGSVFFIDLHTRYNTSLCSALNFHSVAVLAIVFGQTDTAEPTA